MTGITYSNVFNQLVHMVALSNAGKTGASIDNLVITVIALHKEEAFATDEHVGEAVKRHFGLSFSPSVIQTSLEGHLNAGRLVRSPTSGIFVPTPDIQVAIETRVNDAAELEQAVRLEWLTSIEERLVEATPDWNDELWACLRTFMAKSFRRHGAQTVMLLDPSLSISDDNRKHLLTYLKEAVHETCRTVSHSVAEEAVKQFFALTTPRRTKYVAQLLDGTFTFFALTVDQQTSAFLQRSLSPLSLFLDTNFIFGILGLHSNPLNNVSYELVDAIKHNNFPFKLYYHEATLGELERTIWSIGEWLKRHKWSQALSRAASNYGLSGLEQRYHEKNSVTKVDPTVFLTRYENIPELLNEHGFKIYRPTRAREDIQKELDDKRHKLVAEYMDYLKKRRTMRPRKYEAMNHDIVLWQTVQRLRNKSVSLLDAGAFFLSADYSFYSFDWTRLRQGKELGVVVLPNQFLQLLRPFIPITDDFDRRFVETFAIPEFRTSGGDYSTTYSKVLGYLSTFEDLSEATANRILANKILLQKLEKVDEYSEDFRILVDNALAQDNEQLIRENEVLLAQAKEAQRKAIDAEHREAQKGAELAQAHGLQSSAEVKAQEAQRKADEALQSAETLRSEMSERLKQREAELDRRKREAEQHAREKGEEERRKQEAAGIEKRQAEEIAQARLLYKRAEFRLRLLGAAIIGLVWIAVIVAPSYFTWRWLAEHPNRLGLYASTTAVFSGICWSILDGKHRRYALGTLALGALFVLFQILGH